MNTIWFDMDGTIYNFYDIPNWMEMLEKGRYGVYNMLGYRRRHLTRIMEVVAALVKQGWRVGVLTWGSKSGSADFEAISDMKRAWLRTNCPILYSKGYFCCLPYGVSKAEYMIENFQPDGEGMHVLVDDNLRVREDWEAHGENFKTVDASRSYYRILEGLIG